MYKYYQDMFVKDWDELQTIFNTFDKNWIFRGQQDVKWRLVPYIDRIPKCANSDDLDRIIVEAFKVDKKAHFKNEDCPKSNLGWLTFAQHHGGLTRLLDFTRNPFIACFFAFGLGKPMGVVLPETCAIWVVNLNWCIKSTYEKINKFPEFDGLNSQDMIGPEFFDRLFVFDSNMPQCVCPVVSDWCNERVKRQESIFLCKCDPTEAFDINLIENDHLSTEKYIKKISIPTNIKEDVITKLNNLNINKDFLLPGEEYFNEMSKVVEAFEEHARKTHLKMKP